MIMIQTSPCLFFSVERFVSDWAGLWLMSFCRWGRRPRHSKRFVVLCVSVWRDTPFAAFRYHVESFTIQASEPCAYFQP